MLRIIMFFAGVYLCGLSITFMIIYLNLLNQGYNFLEYVNFIISKPVILGGVLGAVLILISIYKKKGKIKWYMLMIY